MYLGYPAAKAKPVDRTRKSIHAQVSKEDGPERPEAIAEDMCYMKLEDAAKKVEDGIEETLICCDLAASTGPVSVPATSLNDLTGRLNIALVQRSSSDRILP